MNRRSLIPFAAAAAVLTLPAWAGVGVRAESAGIVGQGICPTLGCVGGDDKCADGWIHFQNGDSASYVCRTTIQPE